MLYYVILVLGLFSLLFVKSSHAFDYSTKKNFNLEYDLFKTFYNNNQVYYYKNNNILNLSSSFNYKGYYNKDIKIKLNGAKNNFLNLPINNIALISPYFFFFKEYSFNNVLSNGQTQDIELNVYDYTYLLSDNEVYGGSFSSTFINKSFSIDNNVIGYYRSENMKLFLGLNYLYLDNIRNFNIFMKSPKSVRRYNNILTFEYIPEGTNVFFKVTNLNFFSKFERDISNNINATNHYKRDFLKQDTFGNYFIASYNTQFDEKSIWNYYSHIAISNQWIGFNKHTDFIKDKSIYYESIDYKVQNISNIGDIFNNNLLLTYGFNLTRDVVSNNTKDQKFLWPKGIENNYNLFLKSTVNILNLNTIYLIPDITFNHYVYKSSNNNSYKLSNIEPNLEIFIKLIDEIKLFGKYIYKERLPFTYEKYIDGNFFYNDYFVKFNPNNNLKKQSNNEFIGGLLAKFTFYEDNITLKTNFNAFYYKNNNYIDYKFIDKTNVIFSNIPCAIISGYQASLGISAYELETNIIYNIIRGKDNKGDYLNNLYPDNIIIDSSFNIPFIKLITGVKAKLYSKFFNYNNIYPFEKNKIPGYSLFDIYFEYKSSIDHVNLVIGIENIFNKKYKVPYIEEAYKDRQYYFNFVLKM